MKTTSFEFMGPVGTFFMTLGLPIVVFGLYAFCNAENCGLQPPESYPCKTAFWHPHAYLIILLWFFFQALIYLSPLGRKVKGTKLQDGSRLTYNINGLYAFGISHVLFLGLYFLGVPVTFVYNKFLAMACAAFVFSFALAVYLYAKSFDHNAKLAVGGNSGYTIYDWFMGRELNPRVGNFDWKVSWT